MWLMNAKLCHHCPHKFKLGNCLQHYLFLFHLSPMYTTVPWTYSCALEFNFFLNSVISLYFMYINSKLTFHSPYTHVLCTVNRVTRVSGEKMFRSASIIKFSSSVWKILTPTHVILNLLTNRLVSKDLDQYWTR